MAEKSRITIIEDVKVILDENEKVYGSLDLGGEISDPDQLETDRLISRLIPVAVDAVHRIAPTDYLAGAFTEAESAILNWEEYDEECLKATLPETFARVVYVRLGGWRRGVSSFLSEDSPLYAEFFSPYAGVRPTRVYPAAAVVVSETPGSLDLVCCPRGSGDEGRVYYVGTADTSGTAESFNVSDKCYNAMLYYIAHLYYLTLNEGDRSSRMRAECYRQLDLHESAEGDVQ